MLVLNQGRAATKVKQSTHMRDLPFAFRHQLSPQAASVIYPPVKNSLVAINLRLLKGRELNEGRIWERSKADSRACPDGSDSSHEGEGVEKSQRIESDEERMNREAVSRGMGSKSAYNSTRRRSEALSDVQKCVGGRDDDPESSSRREQWEFEFGGGWKDFEWLELQAELLYECECLFEGFLNKVGRDMRAEYFQKVVEVGGSGGYEG
ncbi:hypothetical protein B0H19DRAFT_1069545 [Mycena capillaripes]|nr:hypothetical protein B0H19DRAFT_1069545 [Mycena capillaripes]